MNTHMGIFPYVWSWLTMQASNLGSSCLEMSIYPLSITFWSLACTLDLCHNLFDEYLRSSLPLFWRLRISSLNRSPILFLFICLSFTNDLLVWYAMSLHMIFFTSLTSSSLWLGDFEFNLWRIHPSPSSHELVLHKVLNQLIFMLNSSY